MSEFSSEFTSTNKGADLAAVGVTAGNTDSAHSGFCPVWESPSGVIKKFEQVVLPDMETKIRSEKQYFIYKSENKFETIEADSVVEAIIASKISTPLKIIHNGFRLSTLIDFEELRRKTGADKVGATKSGEQEETTSDN